MNRSHRPVLLKAVLEYLLPHGQTIHRCIDGTLGAGGHARALLVSGVEQLLGLDVDRAALVLAHDNLSGFEGRLHIVQASYAQMAEQAARLGWESVDGILLDLGVSSMQLDGAQRGFSFRRDGPLDMRFDQSGQSPPASEIVNNCDVVELAEILYKYGEERQSRRIAAAIVKNRPYQTTVQLANVISQVLPYQKRRTGRKPVHPATRVFQALRIAVNDELATIERSLPVALDLLAPGGRLAVISFHSLEDRIVKRAFKDASTEIVSPPGMVLEEKSAAVRLITRKPVTASQEEIARNPRSRSARLRVVEKL
jgi:16S rRNA (cytosine1402-N4)-methyltransferase